MVEMQSSYLRYVGAHAIVFKCNLTVTTEKRRIRYVITKQTFQQTRLTPRRYGSKPRAEESQMQGNVAWGRHDAM